MKILSNFDTKLFANLQSEYEAKYGAEYMVVVKRSPIFLVLFVLFPLIICMSTRLIALSMYMYSFSMFGDDISRYIFFGVIWLIVLWVTYVMGWRALYQYINYKMDFCLITPYEIVHYNQIWILNRPTEVIDTEKIKTITKNSAWFRKSFFNYGELIFLSEWDKDMGDIRLERVHDPEKVYRKIRTIIEPHMNQQAKSKISWIGS